MDGFGLNVEVPDSITSRLDNVWIFHGNPAPDGDKNGGLGMWAPLLPGHGWEFSHDDGRNNLSDYFGLELSFAERLREYYPDDKIAIVKYSRGGTSIDSLAAAQYGSWDPGYQRGGGINQYDHFLRTVNLALSDDDIDNDGTPDRLIPSGIIWFQGESDARFTEDIARRYYDNLQRLVGLMRAAFHNDELPVVVVKISDSGNTESGKAWRHGELVQYAQERFVRSDRNAVIVRSTQSYGYYDAYHYDSKGYIDLGARCAEAIYQLNRE